MNPGGSLVATLGGGACRMWHVGASVEDEDASQLELDAREAEFMARLGPVVPTARGTKRLGERLPDGPRVSGGSGPTSGSRR